MDCKEFKNTVADLFDKEVCPETQKACNEHISHCAECRDYYENLLATADLLRPKHSPVCQKPIASNSNWIKIAASFIGVILASGIALAAIHIVRHYQKPEIPQATDTIAVVSPQRSTPNAQLEETDTLAVEPRIFDNVTLDTMLLEMVEYYHVSVKFERKESRQLRFHFVWKRTDDIDRLVEKLNNFEAVNIIRDPEKLIVK